MHQTLWGWRQSRASKPELRIIRFDLTNREWSAVNAKITAEMVRMSEAGFAGTTVSFVNFKDELPYFIDTVLPRLQRLGLRSTS